MDLSKDKQREPHTRALSSARCQLASRAARCILAGWLFFQFSTPPVTTTAASPFPGPPWIRSPGSARLQGNGTRGDLEWGADKKTLSPTLRFPGPDPGWLRARFRRRSSPGRILG